MYKWHYSTHVLNAISPAFTASFELGDLIIDRSGLFEVKFYKF